MLSTEEILDELSFFQAPFPTEAVEAAIARREEITPALLEMLQEAVDDPETCGEEEYCGHIFAMYLLAKFREERAWPLIVRMVSRPEGVDDLIGDVTTEGLDGIMASVCGDDIGGIKALIENPAIDETVRGTALNAIVRLVAAGKIERDEAMSYFAGLFRTLERKPGEVWDVLASSCLDLWPGEAVEEIRQAINEGLIEPSYLGESDIEAALEPGKEGALRSLRERPHPRLLVDDVEEEMSWMAGFEEPEPEPWGRAAPQGPETFVRSGPKIGRNDPCPCGSGKKYKKCCGA